MCGSDTIAKDGIQLIVTDSKGQSYELDRRLHYLWLSNDEETLIRKDIEFESGTADEVSNASLRLPHDLHRMLEISDAANSVWLTKKRASGSHISFTAKFERPRTIQIFKDQKLQGTVSTIDVSILLAESTFAESIASRDYNERGELTEEVRLAVIIGLLQDEFDHLFRDCYLASEKPHVSIFLGLLCYQDLAEACGSEPWDRQTILIEEGESQSVDLQRVTSGRISKSVAPEAKDAKHETVVADEPEGRTEDRFEQALVRLEASQTKLATSLQRSLLAFVLIIGLLFLARGHFL